MTASTVIATRALTKRYGDVSPSTRSSSTFGAVRSTGFSAGTGPGRRRRSACCSASSGPPRGEVQRARAAGARGRPALARARRLPGRVRDRVPEPHGAREPRDPASAHGRTARAVAESIERLRLGAVRGPASGAAVARQQAAALARARAAALARSALLDEPANALDPAGIVEIRELLRSLADERGVTVFMSSHILAEVAHLADRIGIVHEGRLIEEFVARGARRARRARSTSAGVHASRSALTRCSRWTWSATSSRRTRRRAARRQVSA